MFSVSEGEQRTIIVRAFAGLDPLVLVPAGDEVRVISEVLAKKVNVFTIELPFVVGDARLALLNLVLNNLL